jgi:hypothetical protein
MHEFLEITEFQNNLVNGPPLITGLLSNRPVRLVGPFHDFGELVDMIDAASYPQMIVVNVPANPSDYRSVIQRNLDFLPVI